MPSSTAKQAKFMRAIAKSPAFAKKVGVPQTVGADYYKADKRLRSRTRPTLQKVNRKKTAHGAGTKLF